jgi:GAF domain-containing protein
VRDNRPLERTEEHAALRRVATLVARQASLRELAAAIAQEIAGVLGAATVTLDRYEPDGSVVIASLNAPGFPVGSRWPHDQPSLGETAPETGRPAGVPIVVEGRPWGVIRVGAEAGERLPDETETRLARFAELLTTAIANAHAGDGLLRMAEEQAALRRLATLAAENPTARRRPSPRGGPRVSTSQRPR